MEDEVADGMKLRFGRCGEIEIEGCNEDHQYTLGHWTVLAGLSPLI